MGRFSQCFGPEADDKTEAWEQDRTAADMEEYCWEDSPSQRNALDTLLRMQGAEPAEGGAEGGVRAELLGSPALGGASKRPVKEPIELRAG
ncbi:hypothetical protein JZ751_027219 [Albula glossodonta]|uniref:Uncharacterized protein n=1 Tax=Albula glossodonta TaxID=121402 RepID=A0A8T2MQ17_9TELE|nr:hypothetical protein JZ751_027219 [Albula glossodonta]